MSTIDERVVKATFDNGDFQRNVQATLDALERLNKGLKLQGATKGLTDLSAASKNVGISHVADGVDAVKAKFSAMSIVGIAAMASLATKAVDTGLRVVKAFTLDPITAGFQNYETQINAVQTILANTGLKGKAGLDQVTAALDDLNEYANKTVYNFAEMAKNVGTFTAAGVKLDVAKDAIKGIANLAALSGANSEQASMAMYQLSQAIAANKVGLQDWNSVVNAGLGGQVFQKALFNTAQQLHTIKSAKMGETFEQWTAAGNSFRGSLQDGWITGKVLTQTLGQFTGDLTAAQLKSQGYNDEQIKQIMELGKVATNAATQIKTFHQMTQALKEEVASAYASVFKTIFGDINQATGLFTPLHNVLQNLLTGPIYALNGVLEQWSKLGGRVKFIDAMKTGFKDLQAIMAPIKAAFREIFPDNAGQTLYKLTVALDDLVHKFKMGGETANNIKRTFAGLFAALDIGWQIIKNVVHFVADLIGQFGGKSSAGILGFTGSIGDMLVKFDQMLKKGDGIRSFFVKLETAIKPVTTFIGGLIGSLAHLGTFIGPVFGKLGDMIQNIGHILGPVADKISDFFHNLFSGINFEDVLKVLDVGLLGGVVVMIKRLADKFKGGGIGGNFLKNLADTIMSPFHELNETLETMQKTLKATTIMEIAIAVGVLTASVVALSRIDDKGLTKALTAITIMFAQLFGALALMDKIGGPTGMISASAGLILLATAIRVLTSAVKEMSGMSWTDIAKGLGTITVLIAALTIAVRGMSVENAGMVRTGAGLVLLAAAIKVLTSAVKDFSDMSWGDIAKGLTGVAAILTALTLYSKFSEANGAGVLSGAGIVLLAGGIKILASAAQDFGAMNWGEIAKGLTTISAILLAITLFSKGVGNPVTLLASGAALIAIASAMTILGHAMQIFAQMSWNEIAKGLVSMAGALTLIALAMDAMPPTTVFSSGALLMVSFALVAIGKALEGMGQQSWTEIAKGLITLAGALTILAAACYVMEGALPGAAAILVVSAALGPLAAALAVLGSMSWGDIVKSLVALAGAFTVLGVAGLVLTPVAPILLVLGAAVALLGVGMGLAGAGVLAFSTGLTALAVSGAAGASAIALIITTIVGTLPTIVKALGATLVALADAIAKAAPVMLKTAIVLLDTMLKAIDSESPKILTTFFKLITTLLDQLAKNLPHFVDQMANIMIGMLKSLQKKTPDLVNATIDLVLAMLGAIAKRMNDFVNKGTDLVVSFIRGISNNIGRVISAGTDLIIHVIEGIGNAAVRIANAAMDTVVRFVNGLANAISQHTGELRTAGNNLAFAIADGFTFGLASKARHMADSALDAVSGAYNKAKSFLGIHSPSKLFQQLGAYVADGFALGLQGGTSQVTSAWHNINVALEQEIKGAKSDIDKYSKQLWILSAAQNKNEGAIYLTALALQKAKIEAYSTTLAYNNLNTAHKAQYDALQNLGKAYDALTPKVDDANSKLADAMKIRDDYAASIKDQTDVLPDISGDTQLTDYINSLTYQVADLNKFTDVLGQLRKLGLNDDIYKQLLNKGPASLQFAEQLLAGGATAVKNVDGLSDQLSTAAGHLGTDAGAALYQAGVNAAQGIVDGLVKQQDAIKAQMKVIADQLVGVLKVELGIHSPSRVFAALGEFVAQGLAQGLRGASPDVEDASKSVGNAAVESMRNALAGATDLLVNSMDVNPTIAPVIDLTSVTKSVAQLDGMLADRKLTVDTSFSTAKDASAGYMANKVAASEAVATDGTVAPLSVSFTQNNNSPKALSTAEIYRQTNNQLSRVKGALTPSATPSS